MKKLNLIFLILLLTGCGGTSKNVNSPVTWSKIASSGHLENTTQKKYLVFDNQQGLDRALMELSLPQQDIDFGKYRVLMLGIGEHGDGSSLTINSIEEIDTHTKVIVDVNHPGKHCITIDIARSALNGFYKIESNKEILIVENLKLKECTPQ